MVRLATEKSEKAQQWTREAIALLQQLGRPINFSTVCQVANVSKTFLYDPRHADLAEEIRHLRQQPAPQPLALQAVREKVRRPRTRSLLASKSA